MTSKLVLFSVLIVSIAFDVMILAGWFSGLEGAPELMIANQALKMAALGFYSWKAKAENALKIAGGLGKKLQREVAAKVLKISNDESEDV